MLGGVRMIAALVFLAGVLFAGLACLGKEKNNVVWAPFAGSALSLAIVYISSLFLGLNAFSVAFAGAAGLAFFVLVNWQSGVRVSVEKPVLLVLAVSALFFFLAAVSLFRIEDLPRGVRIDFGFHQGIVTSMANGNFPPENPLLAGEPLKYYFLPHLFSAALMVGGFDVQWATWIPFVLWNAALVGGIFLLARKLADSNKAAALAVFLFFLNGTFAFIPYFQTHDVLNNASEFFQNPGFLSDYRTAGFPFENNLVAQSFFTRSFPLGFGLLVLLVFGLFEKWKLKKLGILAGLLPMIHLPSFGLWVLFAAAYAALFDRRKEWLEHFGIAAVVAAPAVLFLLGSPVTAVFRLHVGWMAQDASLLGLVVFWLGNIGLYAALCALMILKGNKMLRNITVAALPAFIIGNVFLFAPNPWDNIKLFLLFFLFLAIGAANALIDLWKKGVAFKTAAFALIVLMTLSGFLHAASIFAHRGDAIYPSNDWQACRWLDQNAPRNALILIDGTHTCAFALVGRKVVVGPKEWLDNHGLNYSKQLEENNAMLAGDCKLLKRYGVDLFYDGGYLGRGASVNRGFWQAQPILYEKQGVTIYRAACEPKRP